MRAPGPKNLAAAAALAAGCRAPTQVKLELGTDLDCVEVSSTSIAAALPEDLEDADPTTDTDACDEEDGRIGSLVLVPTGSKQERLGMRVVLGVGKQPAACVEDGYAGGCIVARRALRYIPHETLGLPIDLERSCLDVPCRPDETCVKGRCVSAELHDPKACPRPGGCLACTPPLEDCNVDPSDGCETDVSTDLAHCGACGAACGSANATPSCTDGRCQLVCNAGFADCDGRPENGCEEPVGGGLCPGPTALAEPGGIGVQVALDGDRVYATNAANGTVVSVPLAGGEPTVLASGGMRPQGVTFDATHVYWVDRLAGTLSKVPKDGGNVVELATGRVGAIMVEVDAADAYWATRSGMALLRTPKDGGATDVLATTAGSVADVALDAASVYWATRTDGVIWKMPLSGGTPAQVAAGPIFPDEIAVDASHVYWTTIGTDAATPDIGTLNRAPKDGGTVEQLAGGLRQPWGIALNDSSVYFTENEAGLVSRMPLGGGEPVPIAANQAGPDGVAVGGGYVVWTNVDGSVWRAAW